MWNLSSGHLHLPEFLPPEGMDAKSYLRMLCDRGIAERYAEVTPELRQRLEYEIQTIEDMGYVEYFLIVWDFINYAKQHNIAVGPGRGSAAGMYRSVQPSYYGYRSDKIRADF